MDAFSRSTSLIIFFVDFFFVLLSVIRVFDSDFVILFEHYMYFMGLYHYYYDSLASYLRAFYSIVNGSIPYVQ